MLWNFLTPLLKLLLKPLPPGPSAWKIIDFVLSSSSLSLACLSTISDVNIDDILAFHKTHNGIATMASWELKSNFGVIESDNSGLVTNYKEKPKMNVWINIGYIVFSTNEARFITNFDTFQEFLENLVETKNLYTYQHNGFPY